MPDSLASSPADLGLAPSICLPAQLSNRSSLRLQSTFQLRLPTGLRPSPHADHPACLPTHLQLAPSANRPAQLSRLLPACAFRQRSGSAFKPNLRLSSAAVFAWRCPLVPPRPSPLINRPALPATTTSDSHRSLHPWAAFVLLCDLRRRFAFQPCLRIQPSTPRVLCPFGAAFRFPCDLRRRSTFQPSLWTQPPTRRLPCSPAVRSG